MKVEQFAHMATEMEYPSPQQSIRVLQEDNVRLLKLVQRYSCFTKMFIEFYTDGQKDEFFELEKEYQTILNEIQCSTSESGHNKQKLNSLPIQFDDAMQRQIQNYTISNSNINSIAINNSNNVMDNLLFTTEDLDVNGQFMNEYLARAMNQNNVHELFSRPMNSPTRQLSLDNESLILNQLNIPGQISMNSFPTESNDFSRLSEENNHNLIHILRTNQALSAQQPSKLYFPTIPDTQPQNPESLVKFASNAFINYSDVPDVQPILHDQMSFESQQQSFDPNSDSNVSMLMRQLSVSSGSNSILQPNTARMPMFPDHGTIDQSVENKINENQRVQHKDTENVLFQPNEETLDLSQNMTNGIHLHRRKLKLTANYHNNSLGENNHVASNNNHSHNSHEQIMTNSGSQLQQITNDDMSQQELSQQINGNSVELMVSVDPLKLLLSNNSINIQESEKNSSIFEPEPNQNEMYKPLEEENAFHCKFSDCNFSAPSQIGVSIHLQKNHSVSRPFKCTVEGCKAQFKEMHKLKVHSVVHTKDKPFKCDYPGCDAKFTQSGHVSRHKKSHFESTNFVCEWEGCNKVFKQKHNLKIHLINHQGGQKPWCCDIDECNRSFVEKWKLVKHKKTHIRYQNMHRINENTKDSS